MSEELDLTNSKWVPENEIYLISIIEGIKEMYPDIDLESEILILLSGIFKIAILHFFNL